MGSMGGYSSDSREGRGGLLVSLNVKGLVSTVRVGHWALPRSSSCGFLSLKWNPRKAESREASGSCEQCLNDLVSGSLVPALIPGCRL